MQAPHPPAGIKPHPPIHHIREYHLGRHIIHLPLEVSPIRVIIHPGAVKYKEKQKQENIYPHTDETAALCCPRTPETRNHTGLDTSICEIPKLQSLGCKRKKKEKGKGNGKGKGKRKRKRKEKKRKKERRKRKRKRKRKEKT